jgi:hypothetical protein
MHSKYPVPAEGNVAGRFLRRCFHGLVQTPMSGKPAEITKISEKRIARMKSVYTQVQGSSDLTNTILTPSEKALTDRAGNLAKVWPEQAVVLDRRFTAKT